MPVSRLPKCSEVKSGIIVLEETASTNSLLKEMAIHGDAEGGTVLRALRQTAGRGRRGHSFSSPEGGLYMSVLLEYRSISPEELLLITPAAAVAVRDALLGVFPSLDLRIKWVNDLLAAGSDGRMRKLCGILAESFTADGHTFVVIGAGINIARPDGGFPPDIDGIAGCVEDYTALSPGCEDAVCADTAEALCGLADTDALRRYAERYRSLVITGRRVTLPDGRAGTALGVDGRCRMEAELPGGEVALFEHGELVFDDIYS